VHSAPREADVEAYRIVMEHNAATVTWNWNQNGKREVEEGYIKVHRR
jgi:hypothetical protein